MIIKSSYKFRIYPNTFQQGKLQNQFGAVRFVYNHFLRQRIDFYSEIGRNLTYHDTAIYLTELKKEPEYSWLKEADAQVLQQSLRNLDVAYNNFFNKRAEFPVFKKKTDKQTCRFPQNIRISKNLVFIPKVGWVKIILHRHIEGKVKNLTISKTKSGKYFASIQVEREIENPNYKGESIGLDLGLKDFATFSNGQKITSKNYFRISEKKLSKLQKKFSKKMKGSKNKEKAKIKVARIHEKIINQRQDFLHKLSYQLIEDNQFIAIEDLSIKNMGKNHKLAKSINDSGWSEFVRQLKYKGDWYGCHIEQVYRFFPSSKRCFNCGFVNQDLTLKDRKWECPECKTLLDRDINAAQNILLFATVGTTESNASGQTVRPISIGSSG